MKSISDHLKIVLIIFILLLGFKIPIVFATEIPPCPFVPETGRTIVHFTIGGHIVSVTEAIVSDTQNYPDFPYRKTSVPATLSAGKYKVTLFGTDVGIDRASLIAEPNEKWFVVISRGSSELARTDSTDDLQDGVNLITQEKVVNTNLELLADADTFAAIHAQYPDTSSPNSLFPLCAAFDLIPPPAPPAMPTTQDNGISNSPSIIIPPTTDQRIMNAASVGMPQTQDNSVNNSPIVPAPPTQDHSVGGSVAIPPPIVQDNGVGGGGVETVTSTSGGGGTVPTVTVFTPSFPYAGLHNQHKDKNTLWNIPQLIAKEFKSFAKIFSRKPTLALAETAIEVPERIIIPSIKVDASIEGVGLTESKALDTPKNIENAGWFRFGPRPGERGTAVIDGHYGWVGRQRVVFDNLDKLKLGDKIIIQDSAGKKITFKVREVRQFSSKDSTPDVFFTDSSGYHLNLITCDGEWNAKEQNYGKRLVVFTDMVIDDTKTSNY